MLVGTGYLCYRQHSIWPAVILGSIAVIMVVLAFVVGGFICNKGAQGR